MRMSTIPVLHVLLVLLVLLMSCGCEAEDWQDTQTDRESMLLNMIIHAGSPDILPLLLSDDSPSSASASAAAWMRQTKPRTLQRARDEDVMRGETGDVMSRSSGDVMFSDRRKKSSVSWLLAAAIRMCQKQPTACLDSKQRSPADQSVMSLMKGADPGL